MIYFDVTKAVRSHHHSGLLRVSTRLREELGARAIPVCWKGEWKHATSELPVSLSSYDWLITPELFSEAERPGFWKFLREKPIRLAAIFHDAIPLKFPQSTWPKSVARHPEYLKMLASFDRIFAVSDASMRELTGFWKWQGAEFAGGLSRIFLGADFLSSVRSQEISSAVDLPGPRLLCLGILEPRKNQGFLLEVVEQLLQAGVPVELDVVGRVNPHFGRGIEREVRRLSSLYPKIRYFGHASDRQVEALWQRARATVFPTLAEGCGLPLIESLARGVPCVCSDLPVLREAEGGGGCVFARANDPAAWSTVLRTVLADDTFFLNLRDQARARATPTWNQAAARLLADLESVGQ